DGVSIDKSSGLIAGTLAPGTAAEGPYQVTVTATDGTYSSNVTFPWDVLTQDSALVGTPVPVTATAEEPFSGLVATFTDAPNPLAARGFFMAVIGWGEGGSSLGMVPPTPAGSFNVFGSPPYATAGTYAVQVVILDPTGAAAPMTSIATVQAADQPVK